jgi:DNA-directed RNA polymerase specialized sigma24 family protein
MPTTLTRLRRPIDVFAIWLEAATTSAVRRALAAGRREADANDIGQEVAEYALTRGAAIMDDYPNPEIFAAVRTFHAGVGWDRRNGAQAGMGAAFGRRQESLHAESHEGFALQDALMSHVDTGAIVEQRLLGDAVRLTIAATLDQRTARWVWDVKGHGLKVSEVARRDGVPRETVSRAVNGAVRALGPVLGEFLGG